MSHPNFPWWLVISDSHGSMRWVHTLLISASTLCSSPSALPISYSLLDFLPQNTFCCHLTTPFFVHMYLQELNSCVIYLVWMGRWEWYLINLSYLLRAWSMVGQWFSEILIWGNRIVSYFLVPYYITREAQYMDHQELFIEILLY